MDYPVKNIMVLFTLATMNHMTTLINNYCGSKIKLHISISIILAIYIQLAQDMNRLHMHSSIKKITFQHPLFVSLVWTQEDDVHYIPMDTLTAHSENH
jgi:hypothetical protein